MNALTKPPTVGERLEAAILQLAKQRPDILSHEMEDWSSITFTGTRHEIVLDFVGVREVEAGEAFIEALPDHTFCIPRQLVADASVREVDRVFGAVNGLRVTCVLLLLKDV